MLFPCWLLPFPILLCFTIAYCATTPGTIALFLEEGCPQDSFYSPASELQVNVCAVTPGTVSLAVKGYPSCSSGEATLIGYQDISCTNSIDDNNITQQNNCSSAVPIGFSAVNFLCDSAAAGSSAKATPTSNETTATYPFSLLEPREPLPQTPPAAALAVAQATD